MYLILLSKTDLTLVQHTLNTVAGVYGRSILMLWLYLKYFQFSLFRSAS